MKKEVEAEGEKNQELFEKFMCYCKNNDGSLTATAKAAAEKSEAAAHERDAKEAQKAEVVETLKKAKADRKDAKEDLASAESVRAKEEKEFSADRADKETNLGAMKGAIAALSKGMGSFLQTQAASTLKAVLPKLSDSVASDDDREAVIAFLEQSGDYAPQSGEIVGILKAMQDEMEKDLKNAIASEEASVSSFNELKAAKEKEIEALSAKIESKTALNGELAVAIVEKKNEAEDAAKEAADATKFAADLKEQCATKEEEHSANQKTRSEEVMAIGEAIKILNDDEALEIFNASNAKKSFVQEARTGFLQIRNKKADQMSKARALLTSMNINTPAVALLQFTVVSKIKMAEAAGASVDFSSVIKMIDDMVSLLKKEQTSDETTRDACKEDFAEFEDKIAASGRKITQQKAKMAEQAEKIKAAKDNIAAQKAQIAELNQAVADAGAQRQNEHKEFTKQNQLNAAAVQLIGKAKNRLQKFYNPKLYKKGFECQLEGAAQDFNEEEKAKICEEQRLAYNKKNGILDQEQLAGMAFVQIRAHVQSRVEPPSAAPETGSHSPSGKSSSVLSLMDMLTKEVETGMAAAQNEEKTAQAEYERLVADTKKEVSDANKSLTDSQDVKATTEEAHLDTKEKNKSETAALASSNAALATRHEQCDFIVEHFEERREARTSELDGLSNAKAVLSGANFA